ncbi:xanthine dehydrogenase family protein molybdopterin-binding subunit [Amycolatopsis ultiminotia]|uniref:Xanthine dehydrogenase family protein molybdopterin-binding subunit n=1 Tax=Amycolatopsis ultiminotia TaxID=543629 RepID=A0ABP6YEN4_9PSEU
MTVHEQVRARRADLARVEAAAKVTGAAGYSMDNSPGGLLHAVLVGAPVARGKIVGIDTAAALADDHVVRVLTRADMPVFGEVQPFQAAAVHLPMQTGEIRFEGEPVAIVLATTIEAAEHARSLVDVLVEARPAVLPGAGAHHLIDDVGQGSGGVTWWPYGQPFRRGDAASAWDSAAVRVSGTYVQPSRHHNAMETSGTLAEWEGNRLTLHDSTQGGHILAPVLADAFHIAAEDVHVIAPFTGGGFGSKGWVWPHQILAAAAAKIAGVPVKLHLRRHDQYTASGFQPRMVQRVELGADSEGRLTMLRHRVSSITGLLETYLEGATEAKALYDCPVIETRQEIERVSIGSPTPLRGTLEGCGLWALESAMNELAREAGIDPLDLRLRNYAETDPISGRPWSSKRLRDAYQEGAKLFGWRERDTGGRRDGPWLIGSGMATSMHSAMRMTGGARVRVRRDGSALVETNITDIGTGLQTVLTLVAAEELDLPVDEVTVAWGDNSLPVTGPIYGSATLHTGSAVALACQDLRRRLPRFAAHLSIVEAIREAGLDEVVGEGVFGLPDKMPVDHDGGVSGYAMRTFGAVFVEVAVDPDLGIVQLRRMVGSYSAGRIMNHRTARSQMIGGLTWAWGKATMEHSELDPLSGRWLSKNLSGVHVPTNADIPADITVHFVDEVDRHASPIGAKGIGELGVIGIDAAVAEAVFDAVGVRIRELPITPQRILV